jgi:hypothetical protein
VQRYKKYFICNSFVLFYSEKFYLIKPDDLLHLSIILLKFAQNDQIMKTNHLIFSLLLILTHLSSYADIVKVGHATYSTDWYEETATLTKFKADYNDINVVIPEKIKVDDYYYTVTAVGDEAFRPNEEGTDSYSEYLDYIETLELPNSITSIGNKAFKQMKKLKEIKLPENLETMGEYAFDGCSSLTELTFPQNLKIIEEYTCYYCSSLKTIHLGKSVQEIQNDAFYEKCPIENIYISATEPPVVGSFAIHNNPINVFVPKESWQQYTRSKYWNKSNFTIEPDDDSTSSVNTTVKNSFRIISSGNGKIQIIGNNIGLVVVYNITGTVVSKQKVTDYFECTLPSGIYFIRTNMGVSKISHK